MSGNIKETMNQTRNDFQKGFTLVEIMIVVAIIGLLVAIGIPNFIRTRQTAQTNTCISNLRIIDQAKQEWALETGQQSLVTPTSLNITPFFGRSGTAMPIEPLGGSYNILPVSTAPSCSALNSNTHNAVLSF